MSAAWQHPDWPRLFLAWLNAPTGSEYRAGLCLALADAAEEMGDEYTSFVWRVVMPDDAPPLVNAPKPTLLYWHPGGI